MTGLVAVLSLDMEFNQPQNFKWVKGRFRLLCGSLGARYILNF